MKWWWGPDWDVDDVMIGKRKTRVTDTATLCEYTKEEWFRAIRQVCPGITEREYSKLWDDFQKYKYDRGLH